MVLVREFNISSIKWKADLKKKKSKLRSLLLNNLRDFFPGTSCNLGGRARVKSEEEGKKKRKH